MPSRKYKKAGADENDFMNLSDITGDENHSLHLSDLQLDDSQNNLYESQNTTIESIPLLEENNSFLYDPESQGSLHLSDLDVNNNEDSLNTTIESIEGGSKRKSRKNNCNNISKKSKKTTKKNINKKTKKRDNKTIKTKKSKKYSRKNKRGGDNLENSIQQSEKHILPQDENPIY